MKFLLLSALAVAVSASTLQFVSVPSSVQLPALSSTAPIRASRIADLNANILGLTAKPVHGFSVETDMFVRPRALATVRVDGVDGVIAGGDKYAVENDAVNSAALEQDLALIFGADRETVSVTGAGISGSAIAQAASQQTVSGDVIKSKVAGLREELEQVYRLAAAIEAQGAKFAASESADVYSVLIQSLSGASLSAEEMQVAKEDINSAIQKLSSALSTAYGDQVVVEVLAVSSAIVAKDANITDEHHIRKRDTEPTDPVDVNLKKYRELYNVSVFTGSDYPAIFAIFAGIVIALVLAVIYTTVGMMTMDPGKDSIIYRMTTTRMKKD